MQAKQLSFFPPTNKEHGGIHSYKTRRSRRTLSTKHSLHITLRSNLAVRQRSLLSNQAIVRKVLKKASSLFQVKVYRYAICGNHLHLQIRGTRREDIQNFFRVFAGHTAQEILRKFPLPKQPSGGAPKKTCKKNQRKFWDLLIYSRILSWGREYRNVARYILQNMLEALNLIAYKPRRPRRLMKRASADPPKTPPRYG
jgi:REP element-mobilizing transposase RayT